MRHVNNLLLAAIFLLFTACSFAPLNTPTSGRGLGEGKVRISGSVLPTLGLMGSYGFSDRLEAGAIVETQFGLVGSVYTKYSFVNNPEGFAFAAYAGAFYGQGFGDSSGFYAGPIVSWRKDKFETYLSLRMNQVSWNVGELTQNDLDDSTFSITSGSDTFDFAYLQTDIGFNFWIDKNIALNLHAKVWTFFSDDFDSDTSILPGAGIVAEF